MSLFSILQLQVRQEKALQRYDDTESEISQLLARHSNETHVLRERLRRSQERERVAERRLKDSEEQLHRSQATLVRLKKLVDQRELGARDELSRKLEEEKARTEEAERKIKVNILFIDIDIDKTEQICLSISADGQIMFLIHLSHQSVANPACNCRENPRR